MLTIPAMTMAEVFRPRRLTLRWMYDIALVAAGSILIALAAQLSIPLPFSPVPITGQTFAVLLIAALLGRHRGVATVLLYLAEGGAGLPVFAGGAAGPAHLVGPTAGYLFGFIVASWVTGALAQRGWDRRQLTTAAAMSIGYGCIFTCGLLWLAKFVGWSNVIAMGLLPFLPGMIVKIALATLLLPGAWKALAKLEAAPPRLGQHPSLGVHQCGRDDRLS
jgi:biotin transport system substrate-specific component